MPDDKILLSDAAKRRIEACVMQAQLNAASAGEDNAVAAADLLCAFILLIRRAGSDPQKSLETCWTPLNGAVTAWWPETQRH